MARFSLITVFALVLAGAGLGCIKADPLDRGDDPTTGSGSAGTDTETGTTTGEPSSFSCDLDEIEPSELCAFQTCLDTVGCVVDVDCDHNPSREDKQSGYPDCLSSNITVVDCIDCYLEVFKCAFDPDKCGTECDPADKKTDTGASCDDCINNSGKCTPALNCPVEKLITKLDKICLTSCNQVPLLCQDRCNVCQATCEEECKVHNDCFQCNADCVTLDLECS
ncbi:MAG TPA: hypothetical protein EYN06_03450 [Myxococcales bacterium]|nr:hypothetical protein [Myxococcales bacterium]